MPAKPHVTIADDNQTPTTAEQQTDTNWAQPVSVRDGHNATLGAKADTVAADDTGTWSLLALVKRLLQKWTAGLDVTDRATRLMGHVTVDSGAVTATVGNFPATQAVSVADGSQVTVGTKADAAATDSTSPWTVVALLKGLRSLLAGVLGVKNVDGTGTELFTVANPAQVTLQASGAPGSAVPSRAVQVAGNKAGTLTVPAVATAADGMSASLDGLVTTAVMMGSNGASRDVERLANVYKFSTNTLAAAAVATIWAPPANKKVRVMGLAISTNVAAALNLRLGPAGSGAAWNQIRTQGGTTISVLFGQGRLASAANDVLELSNVSGGSIDYAITVWGTEE